MINQKLYLSKVFGDDVKALETIEEGYCKVWNFKKEKVQYVDVELYREMDEDVARRYETMNIHNHKAQSIDPNEDEIYLNGFLTVEFGTDTVELIHRVHGRLSHMTLGEGDLIEVQDGEAYKTITIQDVINNIVMNPSKMHTKWSLGQSFYEGFRVRVKVNLETTKLITFNTKQYSIRQLFKAVKEGFLTHEEALETLLKWELNSMY